MIIKHLEDPVGIEVLKMLLRRLHPHHPSIPEIKERLFREQAGHKGEKALIYPLSLLSDDLFIFYNLRLKSGDHFFQNDALILSKEWVLLVEAKYMAGQLNIDDKQLIQTTEKGLMAYDSPLTQVRRHKYLLQKWVDQHGLPPLPIYCVVANSHPKSIITCADAGSDFVIRSNALHELIISLNKQKPALNDSHLQKFITVLLNSNHPLSFNYLSHFNISHKDLRPGIHCTGCEYLGMTRHHGSWLCKKCSSKDKNAHTPALKDYYFIYGPQITNADLRAFLMIRPPATANRFLHTLNLPFKGKNRGRVYYLNFFE
ncbi:nuclease-related domain-containing protein [Halobacillus trueperi]|uniref:NERD domain-containing protein n=1 Tax=Halobacillus trueperi TaxID=156205 RepID=A0A3E0JBV1_9BACI|nr:nuclease-related domain-containing protein [Halobacillus trueperi]REJ10259.1 NERD domain-containing protein [Halobacillus trueperi]